MTSTARRMWHLFEPVHALTYFSPEARAAADAAGMRGFWMGYVAQRAAPLGPVGPAPVTAAFFGFHAGRIERALPDAWGFASPDDVLAARRDGAATTLRRVIGDDPGVAEAADLAWRAAAGADTAGRVLSAANQALPRPGDPLQALWQATATLREHRGDGHVAALVARGIGPVAAHLVKAGAGDADPAALRETRHWPAAAWEEGAIALRARGLLGPDGRLTRGGRALHIEVEEATDAAAEAPWRALGPEATERLATLLAPWADAVLASSTVPVPNPMGLRPE